MTEIQEEIVDNDAAAISEPIVSEPSGSITATPEAQTEHTPVDPQSSTEEKQPISELTLLQKFDRDKTPPETAETTANTEDADKPTEETKKDEQTAEPVVLDPINYEYTLPEKLMMDDTQKEEVHAALDAFRSDPAKGAQGLLDLHVKAMEDFATKYAEQENKRQWDVFNDTRKGWVQEVMSDPQIGGSGHKTAMGAIARVRNQFVPKEDEAAFENFLLATGAGDHPQFLKLLHNVSRFYDEPPLPPPNPKPAPDNGSAPKRSMIDIYKSS
jgi:hypothetical protein